MWNKDMCEETKKINYTHTHTHSHCNTERNASNNISLTGQRALSNRVRNSNPDTKSVAAKKKKNNKPESKTINKTTTATTTNVRKKSTYEQKKTISIKIIQSLVMRSGSPIKGICIFSSWSNKRKKKRNWYLDAFRYNITDVIYKFIVIFHISNMFLKIKGAFKKKKKNKITRNKYIYLKF